MASLPIFFCQWLPRAISEACMIMTRPPLPWTLSERISESTGRAFSMERAQSVDVKEWKSLVSEMEQLMKAHSLTMENANLKLGPMLTIDPKTEQFVGNDSEQANKLLKREYRVPFVVPETV